MNEDKPEPKENPRSKKFNPSIAGTLEAYTEDGKKIGRVGTAFFSQAASGPCIRLRFTDKQLEKIKFFLYPVSHERLVSVPRRWFRG